jgi:hypothetical protein
LALPDPLARTPFFSFGGRPYREERLAAYIRREHQRGRHVSDILDDPYVERCGGASVVHAVLRRRDLIEGLERDVAAAIREAGQSTSIASPKE